MIKSITFDYFPSQPDLLKCYVVGNYYGMGKYREKCLSIKRIHRGKIVLFLIDFEFTKGVEVYNPNTVTPETVIPDKVDS